MKRRALKYWWVCHTCKCRAKSKDDHPEACRPWLVREFEVDDYARSVLGEE